MNLVVFVIPSLVLMLVSTQSTPLDSTQQRTATPSIAPRSKRCLGVWLLMKLLGPVKGSPQNVSLLVDGNEVTLVAAKTTTKPPVKQQQQQQTPEPGVAQGQKYRVCNGKAANTRRCKLYLETQKAVSDLAQTSDITVTTASETDE